MCTRQWSCGWFCSSAALSLAGSLHGTTTLLQGIQQPNHSPWLQGKKLSPESTISFIKGLWTWLQYLTLGKYLEKDIKTNVVIKLYCDEEENIYLIWFRNESHRKGICSCFMFKCLLTTTLAFPFSPCFLSIWLSWIEEEMSPSHWDPSDRLAEKPRVIPLQILYRLVTLLKRSARPLMKIPLQHCFIFRPILYSFLFYCLSPYF